MGGPLAGGKGLARTRRFFSGSGTGGEGGGGDPPVTWVFFAWFFLPWFCSVSGSGRGGGLAGSRFWRKGKTGGAGEDGCRQSRDQFLNG